MTPILYSFRRCPYAMRARLALLASRQACELREVVLKNKPQAMLEASPKATVPVLVMQHQVIDESIDIIRWAIEQNTPENWSLTELDDALVARNDNEFKYYLDRYKYFDRYPEYSQDYYCEKVIGFLIQLERALKANEEGQYFLKTPQCSALDNAIYPFIRQFAFVDKPRFDRLELPKLQSWLASFLSSTQFQIIMRKFAAWSPDQEVAIMFAT